MKSTFKVLFFLKRDKQKANGNVPLFCRITIDGKESCFGIKADISPDLWDIKMCKAIGRTKEASQINSLLEQLTSSVHQIYHELLRRDNNVTSEKVKNEFLGITENHETLPNNMILPVPSNQKMNAYLKETTAV